MTYSQDFENSTVVAGLKEQYRTGKLNSVEFAYAVMDAWARFNGAIG